MIVRPRFALVGVGFVARRHLHAMRAVGGELVAAHDVNDSVGMLDSYFPDAAFFLDPRAFAAYLSIPGNDVDFTVICTPSDLHEEQTAAALELRTDVILEKPPVLDPEGITRLREVERRTGRVVHPILQLRHHTEILAFRDEVRRRTQGGRRIAVAAHYVTRRGAWYSASWKGDARRSGTLIYNLGIHLFDVLAWVFGPAEAQPRAWLSDDGTRAEGELSFAAADVHWVLSTRARDLPDAGANASARRTLAVDGVVVADFSDDYSGLHDTVYREIVARRGHRLDDALGGVVLAHEALTAAVARDSLARSG